MTFAADPVASGSTAHTEHSVGAPQITRGRDSMRAIVQDDYGPVDRWHLTEIGLPEIADTEVLVKVHAAGIDRGTWHAVTGVPYLGAPLLRVA
jgi:hypothetical protein